MFALNVQTSIISEVLK